MAGPASALTGCACGVCVAGLIRSRLCLGHRDTCTRLCALCAPFLRVNLLVHCAKLEDAPMSFLPRPSTPLRPMHALTFGPKPTFGVCCASPRSWRQCGTGLRWLRYRRACRPRLARAGMHARTMSSKLVCALSLRSSQAHLQTWARISARHTTRLCSGHSAKPHAELRLVSQFS
jgi:hypothetical protein